MPRNKAVGVDSDTDLGAGGSSIGAGDIERGDLSDGAGAGVGEDMERGDPSVGM